MGAHELLNHEHGAAAEVGTTSRTTEQRAHDQQAGREEDRQRRAVAAVAHLLKDASADEVETFTDTLYASEEGALDGDLWGPAPSSAETQRAAVANLRKQFDARRQVEEVSASRKEIARLLGTSEQAVTEYLQSRRLTGFKQGRRWMIPIWQLNPDTQHGVLPGIRAVDEVFPGGVVSLAQWATRASPALHGRTPAAALAGGDVEAAITAARQLTAAGW